jgi:hypothetical protein
VTIPAHRQTSMYSSKLKFESTKSLGAMLW